MGALAPLSSWIPEDDLLLKNAVEAGASLESLAKGAVQFSRKFTVRELQERWHSLLYDPIVSAEAAFHMIEFERSASTLPSKFSKSGNSKESKSVSGKRKAESIRNCYYALRKRIRNEPFNTMDLSFLIAPTDSNFIGNEDEPFSGNCILEDPVSTHFGLQGTNLDIMHHSFPEIGDDASAHALHAQFQNTIGEDYPVEQDIVHEEIPHIHGENICHTRNRSMIEEFSGRKELPVDTDQVHECSNFDGDHVFSSPIPDCAVSFHNLDYSSPLPEMPMWRTVEGVSPPRIMHTGDTFSLPCNDDTKNTCLSEYDVHGESSLKLEIPSEEMKNVNASTEGYLAELSNSLLNFTNEEELLFTDVDGKDAIDKSYYDGLSSLLLNSPNDISQERMPDITEPDSSLTPDYIVNQCGASHGELDEDRGSDTGDVIGHSEVQLPELCVEVIICTLNTEDPEIPCNDDIVFTNHLRPKSFSSVARRNFQDSGKSNSSTVKEFSNNPKTSEGGPILVQRDVVNPGQSHLSSQMIRSQVKPEIGSHHPVGDHGNKFDLPSSSFTHMNKGIAYGGSSKNGSMEILVAAKPKEETPEVVPVKHFNHNSVDSSIEKPVFGPDSYKCHAHTDACGLKQDPDAPARIQNHQPAHAKLVSAENAASEQVVNYPVSDPEEPPIESDDDIPYFSDIEAMILDMDLDPEDQDLYLSEEVSRYQHEDTKRVIMRLEQGAQSYMQRAIALQGAFAVLYGRRSKHYIKKSEVLLGRATEDVIVDIDLGREGRANKVSRKQATINLDKSGSFHLKNIGKCSISVNDKEMAPGQSLSLTSSCLIEIRGMPFIFETNQACVKQYLDGTMQKNQTQVHQF
ncbi:uncharacterized protein LOC8275810 [Ricinus communis]|uniref:uncharacterized protein LOC8275810 n=1 Tax=Ricinus communis TaxID=3988 RepID=UPI0007721CE1|nr:uncharacterized protein LOC8275810 [Ricinus communis]|eukprot:XP_015577026.1 uncharacterized protein LOC8275810 [Ricinus communis]